MQLNAGSSQTATVPPRFDKSAVTRVIAKVRRFVNDEEKNIAIHSVEEGVVVAEVLKQLYQRSNQRTKSPTHSPSVMEKQLSKSDWLGEETDRKSLENELSSKRNIPLVAEEKALPTEPIEAPAGESPRALLLNISQEGGDTSIPNFTTLQNTGSLKNYFLGNMDMIREESDSFSSKRKPRGDSETFINSSGFIF